MANYTEQDILDYLDGTFTGEVKSLMDAVEKHPVLKQQLNTYRLLFSVVAEEKDEHLLPSLAEKVTSRIEEKIERKYQRDHSVLFYLLGLGIVATIIYCIRLIGPNLSFYERLDPLIIITCGILVAAFLVFSSVLEMKTVKDKHF